MKTISKISLLIVCFCMWVVAGYSQTATTPATTLKKSGLAPVNGQKVYYEVHGEGAPIVLLHGAFMTIDLNWGQIIPELAKTRKVIALEMQGHGHTPHSARPLSYPVLASDVAGVMQYLKIDSADILGYSFGGTIAYQLAISHPKLVKNLIIISSTYKTEGWQPEVREVLKTLQPEFLENTPLKTEYVRVAPDSNNWRKFISQMIAFDNSQYNLGDDSIATIKKPVLLIIGDNDGIDKPILIDTYRRLGGTVFGDMAGLPTAQLAILPGKTHVGVMMDTPAIFSLVNGFLNPAPQPEQSIGH